MSSKKSESAQTFTTQENYLDLSGCGRCKHFLNKCNRYKKMIRHYRKKQMLENLAKFVLLLLFAWVVGFIIFQVSRNNNLGKYLIK